MQKKYFYVIEICSIFIFCVFFPTQKVKAQTISGFLHTTANVIFHIEGLDISNISNISPSPEIHGQSGWPFTIYVYSGSTFINSFTDIATQIATDSSSPLFGTFQNPSFNLQGLPSGTYRFYASSPFGSLRTQIFSPIITITGGQNNVLVALNTNDPSLEEVPYFVMGDIDGDNEITIKDYSILIDCYGKKSFDYACQNDKAQLLQKPSFKNMPRNFLPGDFNDNGIVDGIDYNIFLRAKIGTIGKGGIQK